MGVFWVSLLPWSCRQTASCYDAASWYQHGCMSSCCCKDESLRCWWNTLESSFKQQLGNNKYDRCVLQQRERCVNAHMLREAAFMFIQCSESCHPHWWRDAAIGSLCTAPPVPSCSHDKGRCAVTSGGRRRNWTAAGRTGRCSVGGWGCRPGPPCRRWTPPSDSLHQTWWRHKWNPLMVTAMFKCVLNTQIQTANCALWWYSAEINTVSVSQAIPKMSSI